MNKTQPKEARLLSGWMTVKYKPTQPMKYLSLTLAGLLTVRSVSALTISIDYSLDSSGFFSSNLTAKAALEQAAADVGGVITSSLGALSPSTLAFTGTNGSTTATADWSVSFTHPTTGAVTSLGSFSSAAGEFKVFAGARSLTGSTLGQGGPVGVGLSLGRSGIGSEFTGAVSALETASNSVMTRGDGPVIGTVTGSLTLGGTTANYSLGFGALAGVLTFDNDANNDGFADADLSGYWQFDHTTSVGAGLNDFYSVALHEILHTLGFGVGESWNETHSGTTWLGEEGIDANGTGLNLVDGTSLAHVAPGVFSTTLDGEPQEALMDPTLTTGTRKFLTVLDLAMLADIGYSVSAVPEPASWSVLTALGMLVVAGCRRRRKVV
jgi:hypothetical protein